jgi:hypothetical protein
MQRVLSGYEDPTQRGRKDREGSCPPAAPAPDRGVSWAGTPGDGRVCLSHFGFRGPGATISPRIHASTTTCAAFWRRSATPSVSAMCRRCRRIWSRPTTSSWPADPASNDPPRCCGGWFCVGSEKHRRCEQVVAWVIPSQSETGGEDAAASQRTQQARDRA